MKAKSFKTLISKFSFLFVKIFVVSLSHANYSDFPLGKRVEKSLHTVSSTELKRSYISRKRKNQEASWVKREEAVASLVVFKAVLRAYHTHLPTYQPRLHPLLTTFF